MGWRSGFRGRGCSLPADYLSSIEIPTLGDFSSGAQPHREPAGVLLATLDRLRPLVQGAEHVVPGHGPVLGSAGALADSGGRPRLPATPSLSAASKPTSLGRRSASSGAACENAARVRAAAVAAPFRSCAEEGLAPALAKHDDRAVVAHPPEPCEEAGVPLGDPRSREQAAEPVERVVVHLHVRVQPRPSSRHVDEVVGKRHRLHRPVECSRGRMGGRSATWIHPTPPGRSAAHQFGEDPLAPARGDVLEDQIRVHEVVGAAQLVEPLGGAHSMFVSPIRPALRAASPSIEGGHVDAVDPLAALRRAASGARRRSRVERRRHSKPIPKGFDRRQRLGDVAVAGSEEALPRCLVEVRAVEVGLGQHPVVGIELPVALPLSRGS